MNALATASPAAIPREARPLLILRRTLEERYGDLAAHGQNVARYCAMTARALGFAEPAVARIALAGALHDIGKVAVDDDILSKPGPLTEAEWMQIQIHPEVGANLLFSSNLDDIARWVLAHHERPDGRGYPYGIGGDALPIEAQILAVVDSYDAMTTDRVYKEACDHDQAAGELRSARGRQFDAAVVDAFLDALERRN